MYDTGVMTFCYMGDETLSINNAEFMTLYYMKDDNMFMDGEGFIIYDLFEIITPNDLYMFRKDREDMIVKHATIKGYWVEILWPEENDYCFDPNLCHDHSIIDIGDDYERVERYERNKTG